MPSVAALALAVALSAGGRVPDPLPWDGQSWRTYRDPVAQVAFPVPLTQTRVESRHFRGASAAQMTDVLTLSGPEGFELEIGIWRNPQRLALKDWIASYAGFLRSADTTTLLGVATPAGVDAQLFEQPRDGQTWARRSAVFEVGDRVFKVTCLNRDDPRSEAEFEAAVAGFQVSQ